MYEKVGNDYELFYRYDNDGKLSMIVRYNFSNSTNYYYNIVTNAQGDVVEILSGSGSVLVEYTYDAWGNIVSIKNGSGTEITSSSNIGLQNSIRYRGYVYDNETGLYYLQSRYYDPEVGRFINCDDVDYIGANDTPTGWNGFSYCENDPVNNVDNNGYKVAKYTNSTCYLYVYYYDKKTVSPMGHVDVSFDGKNIFSYGTYNGSGGGAAFKQYKYNAKDGGYFGKYAKCVKIKMTFEECIAYQTYISACFLLYTAGSPYEGGTATKKIYEYRIIRGPYEDYLITKCNCSTFVADVLTAVFPEKIKKVSIIYRKLTMIPYFTYLVAQKLSK